MVAVSLKKKKRKQEERKAVNKRIQVTTLGYERWRVGLLLEGEGATEELATEHLREVKAELTLQTGIPEEHLKYVRLLNREQTPQGLLVEMEIVKQDIRKGLPWSLPPLVT